MAIERSHRRFSVNDYHHMGEVGILTEDDRVELIDGEIIEMSPLGGRHVTCVSRLTRLLVSSVGDDAVVNIQSPVRLDDHNEPEPDAAVVRARNYGQELPTPHDVLLLIEATDTSLGYDRATKLPLYARAGIQEFWIVDVQGETIERHTNPVGNTYRLTVRAGRGEVIESLAVAGLVLNADDILG